MKNNSIIHLRFEDHIGSPIGQSFKLSLKWSPGDRDKFISLCRMEVLKEESALVRKHCNFELDRFNQKLILHNSTICPDCLFIRKDQELEMATLGDLYTQEKLWHILGLSVKVSKPFMSELKEDGQTVCGLNISSITDRAEFTLKPSKHEVCISCQRQSHPVVHRDFIKLSNGK